MARFVPFIVDAGDNQKIGVQITRMKKNGCGTNGKRATLADKLDVGVYSEQFL